MEEIIEFVDEQNNNCNGDVAFFTYDPVISWNLYTITRNTYSPFNYHKNIKLKKKYECLVIFNTFGGVSIDKKNKLKESITYKKYIGDIVISTDKYYKFKQLLNPDYPEDTITASIYKHFDVNQSNEDWVTDFCTPEEKNLFCNF